jgi:hypothetical protein
MKRNVNLLLLWLVLASMFAMILMDVYYNTTYDELVVNFTRMKQKYEMANNELNRTISEVEAKEELLNRKEVILTDYISELNLSRERETSLGTHFIDLKNENVYLGDKLNKTVLDRERWQSMYNATQRNYDVCRVDLNLEETRSNERLDEINRIEGMKPSMDAGIGRLGVREGDVSSNVGDIDGLAGDIDDLADSVDNSSLRSGIKSKANEIKTKVDSIGSLLDKMMQDISEIDYLISRI